MPQSPFYSSPKWRKVRASYLARHPNCVVCARVGIAARAVEVDHKKTLATGGAPFDDGNLQGLCKTHHSQKTIMIDGQHNQSGKPLVTTGLDGFPVAVEVPRNTGNGANKIFGFPEAPRPLPRRRGR